MHIAVLLLTRRVGGCRYCDPTEVSPVGVVTPETCPRGYYCLLNTETKHEYPCPVGAYGNRTELESSAECNLCDGGYYCPTEGEPGLAVIYNIYNLARNYI